MNNEPIRDDIFPIAGDNSDGAPSKTEDSHMLADSNANEDVGAKSERPPRHPIADAILKGLHRYRDIEAVSRLMVPVAARMQKDMWDVAHKVVMGIEPEHSDSQQKPDNDDAVTPVSAELDDALVVLDRLSEADLPYTLLTSLFLGLFSAFDAFTGNLLRALFLKRPALIDSLDTEVSLAEILRFETFQDLKESVLADYIESIRRKSYVEQFEVLEKRFGLALRKFENWPKFVEMGQRRNLITHCEGVVSKQYIAICKSNAVVIPEGVREGERLRITLPYLLEACSVLYEVSIKLGQVLWRKVMPEEYNEANSNLAEPIYEALKLERWDRAIMLSAFAMEMRPQISELDRRIRLVNYAIALKFSGKAEESLRILDADDWSAAALDFKLAVAVLHDQYGEAAQYMRQIGEEGELVNKSGYHTWPLFREFRRSTEFAEAYAEVFGQSFEIGAAEAASQLEDRERAGATDADDGGSMGDSDGDGPSIAPPLPVIKRFVG